MTAGGELQKSVSGHFAHYSDEDTDVEMNNCCVALENEITISIVQYSGGFATSAISDFMFCDKYFLLSLGTICETGCFEKQPNWLFS